MNEDPRKMEHDFIQEAKPLINMMGASMATERSALNTAVKAQLRFVYDQLQHYLPTAPRGFGDDEQMPHEWGSMDTYDDMRNSLRLAAAMMDELLCPDTFSSTTSDDEVETLRELIVISECGFCATAEDVLKAAGLEGDDDFSIIAATARRVEVAQGLPRNSLWPTSEED